MIHLSLNIGYESSFGRGTLTKYPTYYQLENFKEFSDLLRDSPFESREEMEEMKLQKSRENKLDEILNFQS